MQKTKQTGKKTRQEVKEEFRKALNTTKQVFVRELAEAIRDENPQWYGRENLFDEQRDEIREMIYADCEELGLNLGSVKTYIPSWLQYEKRIQQTIKGWETRNAKTLEKLQNKFAEIAKTQVTEPPVPKEQEDEDDKFSDVELHEMGLGKFAGSDKPMFSIVREIHTSAGQLFKILSNGKYSPTSATEDLLVDYIKPTREYRLSIALELSKKERAVLHNQLVNVIEIAEDMVEQIDKADKK